MTASPTLCAALLMLMAVWAGTVAADPLNWEVATPFPETSKPQTALVKAAKKLARSSDGAIRVHFTGRDPDPDTSMLDILSGDDSSDAALVPYTELSALNPDSGLYGQFFAFADFPEVRTVRRSLDRTFLIHAQTDDYAAIAILGLGFVHLMSDSRFQSTGELAGRSVFVPLRSTIYDDLLKSMAMNPRTDAGEAPSLMLAGTAALILDRSLPRLEYIVSPPVHYVYLVLVAKRSRWLALPPDHRETMQDLFVEELDRLERDAERAGERAHRVLSRHGMQQLDLRVRDVEVLRGYGIDGRISVELQSQFRDALAGSRQ